MLQESGAFDLRTMTHRPSTTMEIYTFFLVFAFVTTAVKLVRVWRIAMPFRLSRQPSNLAFLQMLERSAESLKQWIGCTLIGWGILTSLSVSDMCNHLIFDRKIEWFAIVPATLDLSVALTAALVVVLSSFLARWHMLKRIEYLRGQALQSPV